VSTQIPQLLSPKATAEILGVTESTLAIWRCDRRYDLPFVKCGSRVRYRAEDVAKFIESRRVKPGAEFFAH
jgi:predicted site-specific integrase-resolvase